MLEIGTKISKFSIFQSKEKRQIFQLQVSGSKLLASPAYTLEIIKVINEKQLEIVKTENEPSSSLPTIFIHTPGQATAFVAIFNAVNQFSTSKTVDLITTVSEIRANGRFKIKPDQLRFCYEVLIAFATKFLKLANIANWSDLL
jgi:hypothetical protein